MLSDYSAAISRIEAIESRLQSVLTPASAAAGAAPPASALPAASTGSFASVLQQAFPPAASKQYSPYIEGLISRYSSQYGLSPNLVRAVIAQESDGNAQEVSSKGAMGLMQIMPQEARSLGVSNPFDPEQNIAAGTRLLAGLMKRYNGDVPLTLAAYNAGPGAVQKYNGIPPYPETEHYVKRILGMMGAHTTP